MCLCSRVIQRAWLLTAAELLTAVPQRVWGDWMSQDRDTSRRVPGHAPYPPDSSAFYLDATERSGPFSGTPSKFPSPPSQNADLNLTAAVVTEARFL